MIKSLSILGAGWLGLPLALKAIDAGFTVKLASRSIERTESIKKSAFVAKNVYQIDIEKLDSADVKQQKLADFLDTDLLLINITSKNVEAFKNLIAIIKEKKRIQKIVFVSSTSVYAQNFEEIDECTPSKIPLSVLSQIEDCFLKIKDCEVIIARSAGLMGTGRHPGTFFKNKAIPRPKSAANFIVLEDCIIYLIEMLKNDRSTKEKSHEIYNLCAPTFTSRYDFYSAAARHLSLNLPEFIKQFEEQYTAQISSQKLLDTYGDLFNYPKINTYFEKEGSVVCGKVGTSV